MYDKNSGHFSPIVAYNEDGDYVLVMDVASHLGVWVWIKLEDLYRLMNGTLSGIKRGYIVVKRASTDFDLNEVKNYDDGIADLVQKQIDEQALTDGKSDDNKVNIGNDCKVDGDGKCDIDGDTVVYENNIADASNDNAQAKKVVKLRKVKVKGTSPVKKVKITNVKSVNSKNK